MSRVLELVEAHLTAELGEPDARAAVTFLGADRVEVLRFTADTPQGPVVRYATLGMSGAPMTDPTAPVADPERGPRAELLLAVRPLTRAGGPVPEVDKVLRPLAVLAASPQVEGVVVAPGASLDVGEPLWPGAPFTSVLVAEPGGVVPDLELPDPKDPVRFLPLLPMTPNEAAWKRVHGAQALEQRWLDQGTDLRDPGRGTVPLTG
ncbi:suppressor of fused domain protein [Streptomyces alkaliterrae]|uniref:Suppressor of fused domain protein n=1 Tax=Streptomyces alkaliterrae TaxID=2213162 RepID=A0A5P0YV52_9ACTN|nr:suppressor of fused domain protein [Streptomyces alkaliterrae]MBB1255142.1 suppressor of fused domain protein [Streptomyces alkaliterrae]MBB1261358.1 suppressor of fused domain protein [Streptomyces alkaliterrae]MQS02359.1 suppressor of fused domain protein [Streptomyces alkaliterrae]